MSQIRAYIGPSRCPLAHSGLVLSHASLMCDESQLAEMLDPDRTTRHGHRVDAAYDPVTRYYLRTGEYTLASVFPRVKSMAELRAESC